MGRPKKNSGIQVTGWTHKSQMDPKYILGDRFDPTKHYRFVRQDRAEFVKQAHGYEPTDKKFKELVLMQTSKDHAHEREEEKRRALRARKEATDRSVEREVNQEGTYQGKSLATFTKG